MVAAAGINELPSNINIIRLGIGVAIVEIVIYVGSLLFALHTHEQALPDEAASAAALGMTYTHIPVDFDAPTEDHYTRFRAAMAAADGAPVHVHCIVNARVTAFFYRWQQDVFGTGEAEARAMMDTVWRPGGVWAGFIGDDAATAREHRFRGRDY